MSTDGVLVVTASALVGCGVFLMLERSLSRVLLGLLLLSNGVNVVLLTSGGAAGGAPIVGRTPIGDMSDPLPQALALTAIVITLATTAFVLAMAYRSWQLNGNDDVQDDVEDAVIRRLAEQQEASDSYDLGEADDRDDGIDPEQVSEETA